MKSKIVSLTLVVIAFTLGASALSALADWTSPTCTPPNCNTPTPLNVATTSQSKAGPLQVNWNSISPVTIGLQLLGKIQIINSDVGFGKVLTSDADGVGTWQTPASASIVSGIQVYRTPGSYTWTKPSGAKFAKITVAGAGGPGIVRGGCGGSGGLCEYIGGGDGGLAIKVISLENISSLSVNVGLKGEATTSTVPRQSSVIGSGISVVASGGNDGTYDVNTTMRTGDSGQGTGGDINFGGRGAYGQFRTIAPNHEFYNTGAIYSYLPEDGYVFIEYY